MTLRKVDQKYLAGLEERQRQLDLKIKQREEEQTRVSRVFVEHVRKEMDLLIGEKEKMTQRN